MAYKVYRNGKLLKTVWAPATQTSDTSVAPLTTYSYKILAVDNARNRSAKSAASSATTPSCCSYSVSPTDATIGAEGGNGDIAVTAGSSCLWTPTSTADWLSISSAVAVGNGTVSWFAAANTSTNPRTGHIIIGGQSFTVTQAGAGPGVVCNYTVVFDVASFAASGGSGSAVVTTSPGCNWTASSSENWIHTTSAGNDSGVAQYTVDPNTGSSPRSGTITIAGHTYTVSQAGVSCSYSISPTSAASAATGGGGSVSVTAGAGCAWSASSGATWITVTPASGSGNGAVSYSVAANTGASSRSGTITIAGYTFNVSQYGVSCSYSISPMSAVSAAGGGGGSVSVTADTGCAWSASSGATWITITPASGSGNGAVSYSVAANSGTSPRSGTMTIAGYTFTVNQAGVSCSYSISPTSAASGAGGGGGSVSVTAGAGCAWSASSGAAWITIASGASGSGNGTVNYSVAANTSAASRSGYLTAAGQTFTVNQAGLPCSYSLTPSSASVGAGGGPGSVRVTAGSGCGWIASSSASWISVTAGSAGSGDGSVSYTVTANTSVSSRSGTLNIAGQNFNVTQAGVADNPPYSVTLTAPTSGATLSGTVTFNGMASDDVGVSRVEFWCDGSVLLGTDTTAPYSVSYSTTELPNGTRTFTCKAYDTTGKSTTSPSITANVNNTAPVGGAWATRFGGTSADYGAAVAVTGNGDVVVAGVFGGAVDFGGGVLVSSGSTDMFIAKYSAAGTHLWSRRFGGTGNERPLAMALDGSGNILVAGNFSGTASLGGASFSSTVGSTDAFIAKYSPDGAHVWSQVFGGPLSDQLNSIAVDSQGNAIVSGFFQADLTPMVVGTTSLNSWGMADTLLAKFSPNGVNLWAMNFYNGGRDQGNAVAVDRNDNIIVAGYYLSFVDFGGGVRNKPGGFLAKFSPSGQWLMDRNCSTGGRVSAIDLDSNGDIAVSGIFFRQTDFGAGVVSGTAYDSDMFVAKYSGTDFGYRWAATMLGTEYAGAAAMAIDAQNNIILTGSLVGTVRFGAQTLSTGIGAPADGFVAKYSSTGAAVWARGFGGASSDGGYSVAVGSSGHPVMTGCFSATASISGQSLTSAGSTDMILGAFAP
jgi:hypothetical protein